MISTPSKYLQTPGNRRCAAFAFVAMAMITLVGLEMLVPLLSTMVAYSMVGSISNRLIVGRMPRGGARFTALSLVALAIIAVLLGISLGAWVFLHSGGGFQRLIEKMGDILLEAHHWLPAVIAEHLPERDTLFGDIGAWLKNHAGQIGGFGLQFAKQFGYCLLGIILGAMMAVSDINRAKPLGAVSELLLEQVHAFKASFIKVAAAQVRISAFNTMLTGFYLLAVLPALGVDLPLRKTMIAVTFVVGLLPVIGNLVSNSVITIISVGHSLPVGIASISYLVVIHKLEYFLNARLVGAHINARAWEILLMMILGERLLGISGVVFAPIFYAWLKSEWHAWDRDAG